MDEKVLRELLGRDLDGVLSPEEKLRVEKEIAASPQIREVFAESRAVHNALRQVREVDPPATLKPSILREIERRRAPARRSVSIRSRLAERFRVRPALAYPLVFAAGILIGVLGLAVFSTPPAPVEGNDVLGSLSLSGSLAGATAGPQMEIRLEGVRGSVATEQSKDFAILRCSLESDHPSEIVITFDPARTAVVAAKNDQTKGTAIAAREGEVRLSGELAIRSTILLTRAPGNGITLHVSVNQAGSTVFERDLVVGGESPG